MLSWGGANPQESLQGLLQIVERLLQPSMGDSASLYVGDLILQILQKMPAQVLTPLLSPDALLIGKDIFTQRCAQISASCHCQVC